MNRLALIRAAVERRKGAPIKQVPKPPILHPLPPIIRPKYLLDLRARSGKLIITR